MYVNRIFIETWPNELVCRLVRSARDGRETVQDRFRSQKHKRFPVVPAAITRVERIFGKTLRGIPVTHLPLHHGHLDHELIVSASFQVLYGLETELKYRQISRIVRVVYPLGAGLGLYQSDPRDDVRYEDELVQRRRWDKGLRCIYHCRLRSRRSGRGHRSCGFPAARRQDQNTGRERKERHVYSGRFVYRRSYPAHEHCVHLSECGSC